MSAGASAHPSVEVRTENGRPVASVPCHSNTELAAELACDALEGPVELLYFAGGCAVFGKVQS